MEEADSTLQSVRISPPGGVPVLAEKMPGAGRDGFKSCLAYVLGGAPHTMRLYLLHARPEFTNAMMQVAYFRRAFRLRRPGAKPTFQSDHLRRRQHSGGSHPAVPARGSTRRRSRKVFKSSSAILMLLPIR